MTSTEALHQRLLVVASLLDTAAGEVRDIPLSPIDENIHHIGNALAEIYDLLRAIYAVRPDLVPAELEERRCDREANLRFTPVITEAFRLAHEGNVEQAILALQTYVNEEPSELHKSIAAAEITHFHARGSA